MTTFTVLLILTAVILIGLVVTCFLLVNKKAERTKQLLLEAEKEQLIKDCRQGVFDSEKKLNELKIKYETLLSESKSQIVKFDEQLKDCIEGQMDENPQSQFVMVEELKKKVKALQEEVEDNKDDFDTCRKKLKKKDEEYSTLQDLLSKKAKAFEQQKEEVDELNTQLEDRTNELNLKIESLRFVQEVLSAKPVGDTETKEIYRKVDILCDFVSGELKDCLKKNGLGNEQDYFEADLSKWAVTTKKNWIQGKTTVAFVGEFSAGKTSIVNRILSQDDPNIPLLPISSKATTAIPTYITGGSGTYYNFITPDNIQKSISEETFKRVNKDVLDQVKGVSSLIQYFVMKNKNPHLQNLSILDTPGFNSNDKEDAKRTIDVINECDALFWVFDVNLGTVNRSSITLIKEYLKKPLYIVINKVDTKAEIEVERVEHLIRETLKDERVPVEKFIRFSSKVSLDNMMKLIMSITHDTTQDSYISRLRDKIDGLVNYLDVDRKNARETRDEYFKNCDALNYEYERASERLVRNCKDAERIPLLKKHLFSKDRYEMSKEEYNELESLLNTISNICKSELCDLCAKQKEALEKAQEASSDYLTEKNKYQEMTECKERYDKLVRTFLNIHYDTESI